QGDEIVNPGVDLLGRLTAWATVGVDLPVRILLVDLLCGQSFVAAIVDLAQKVGDLRVGKPGQLRGLERALHGTRVDRLELHAAEPAAQLPRIVLTSGGEGQVRGAGVLSREAPLGLAVAGEIQVEAQAGLPIISGRPERRERLALSITA